MSFSASAIALSISKLAIPGVIVLDLSEIPELADLRGGPLLFPNLSNWGGEMNIEQGNISRGPLAYYEVTRDLGYIYLHENAGAGRGIADYTIAMSNNRDAIIEALCEMTDVDVRNIKSGPIGKMLDINENEFYGFLLTITVWEQINP